MNATLQRHAAKFIYIVPEGLRELMTDISREVLRSQPKDVYMFIADYLEALLLTRENARVAARLVQSITEITTTTCEFLKSTGMERPEADRIVSIIQKTFKKHVREQPPTFTCEQFPDEVEEANLVSDIIDEAKITPEQGEQAATIIQQAYRNFKQRKQKEKELLIGMIDWRVAARSAIRLYRQTGVTNEEANRAATLIKAAYKGYYTRQILKKLNDENRMLNEDQEEEISESETSEEESVDMNGEVDENRQESAAPDSRLVKINYDTVIPHVDFGDVNFEVNETAQTKQPTNQKSSTTSAVISFAMQQILDSTFDNVAVDGLPEEEDLITSRELESEESKINHTQEDSQHADLINGINADEHGEEEE